MKNKYAELLSQINNNPRDEDESILIIDGLNTFLRSFTVIQHLNQHGHHIGGLTGFLKSLGYVIKITNPTKVVIVFDGVGGSNSKRNLFPDYKGQRNSRMTNYDIFSNKDEENESISNQMERLIQYLSFLPVTIICVDGIEADDVMGYLVNKLEKNKNTKEVIVSSADQDFLQLVSNKTKVYSPIKKKFYGPDDVLREYKVSHLNYINYKILMGDKSDNLPGIDKLGPKKILKLFPGLAKPKALTLEGMLKEATKKEDEHKLYSIILSQKRQLEINKQLMDLKNIPLSKGNIKQIQEEFKSPYKLDTHSFMQMYMNDKLGESIPNVNNWLNQVFGSLK